MCVCVCVLVSWDSCNKVQWLQTVETYHHLVTENSNDAVVRARDMISLKPLKEDPPWQHNPKPDFCYHRAPSLLARCPHLLINITYIRCGPILMTATQCYYSREDLIYTKSIFTSTRLRVQGLNVILKKKFEPESSGRATSAPKL